MARNRFGRSAAGGPEAAPVVNGAGLLLVALASTAYE
jgi:hypothetical protein